MKEIVEAVVSYVSDLGEDEATRLSARVGYGDELILPVDLLSDDLTWMEDSDTMAEVALTAIDTSLMLTRRHEIYIKGQDIEQELQLNMQFSEMPTMCGGMWAVANVCKADRSSAQSISLGNRRMRRHTTFYNDEGIAVVMLPMMNNRQAEQLARYFTIGLAIAHNSTACITLGMDYAGSSFDYASYSVGVSDHTAVIITHAGLLQDFYDEELYDDDGYDEFGCEYRDRSEEDEGVDSGWFDCDMTLDEVMEEKIPANMKNFGIKDAVPENVHSIGASFPLTGDDVIRYKTVAVSPVIFYRESPEYIAEDEMQWYDDDTTLPVILSSNLGWADTHTLEVMREFRPAGYYKMSPSLYATNPNEGHHMIAAICYLPHPTYVASGSCADLEIKEATNVKQS